MVVAGLVAAAPSSPPRPRCVVVVALTTLPSSSSRAWRKHSAGGFDGLPLSNLSLPPRLITRSGREDARTGAAARLSSPRCWARRCGGSPPFLHRRRRSITGAAGLAVCCCGVTGEPRCRRRRTLPSS
ncbi:uncharacterized protein [Arachis hypogaea]|uniref:uncharacterized protein n=1 Tax=Arachis hypogaea TaxID=3818 RepID=UPI003B228B8B